MRVIGLLIHQRKKLGGGVVLTQIHELDYLNYFFSNYKLENYKYISQDFKFDNRCRR